MLLLTHRLILLRVVINAMDCQFEIKILAMLVQDANEHTSANLTLTWGSLPSWLEGVLIRVGPGLFEYGGRYISNICDGLSKVHKWSFSKGQATNTRRMLKSGAYNKSMEEDKILHDVLRHNSWSNS